MAKHHSGDGGGQGEYEPVIARRLDGAAPSKHGQGEKAEDQAVGASFGCEVEGGRGPKDDYAECAEYRRLEAALHQ